MRLCLTVPLIFSVSLILLSFSFCTQNNEEGKMLQPPVAKRVLTELEHHGDTRKDFYYWLNQRNNPDVINYLQAENNYTLQMMKETEKFQKKLFNEMKGRVKQDEQSVPYFSNGYFYYQRFEEGSEYPIYCRKENSLDNDEQIILDVNEMSKGHSYYHVTGVTVSPNNKLLAFGVDTVSRRQYKIMFKNLETGEILENKIPNTTATPTWASDNKTIFYAVKDNSLRSYKIYKHNIDDSPISDKEIHHEMDATFSCYVYKSKDNSKILIASVSTLSTEYRFVDSKNPESEFKIVNPREKDLEYHVYPHEDEFYILTNYNAKNFRIMKSSANWSPKENWKEIIPHNIDVRIEDISVFKNHLAIEERYNGLVRLKIVDLNNHKETQIKFDDPTYSTWLADNYEYTSTKLRFRYSSLTTPRTTYDVDLNSFEKTIIKQDEVLGNFNSENYVSERLFAPSRDGKMIPISLVYKKDRIPNTDQPLLLYAYGSYGVNTDAEFRSVRLSLLDRGFIFAIAHVRGGEELGRDWYEDGKLLNKKNSFNDFIDCSKHLVDKDYTSTDKLFAMGGSAGGLLVGAIVNMQPKLYKAVVAQVPFVDVVTTMFDESIPLTTSEYDEWGNPKNKEFYDYMLSYSPYDQIEEKEYCNIFVTTGLHDSQVQYWEPAKWVAKLRYMKKDNNKLMLYTNMTAGHSGSSGRFEQFKEIALEYAFIFNQLGIVD